jgi:hypothetical protein
MPAASFQPDPNAPTETRTLPRADGALTLTGDGRDGRPRALPVIPGYRVVRELGRGGMGEVYEVVDDKLGVTFALKTIRPDRVGTRFLVRFRREAATMIGLDHPNVARIYRYDETPDGCPYFTMRYLPDGTLADRRGRFRGEPRAAAALIATVARAVHYLHGQGYVHRDLKPQNILFAGDEPFVSDFGLAKAQGDPGESGDYSPAPPAAETDPIDSRAETHLRETRAAGPAPAPLMTATGGVIGTLPYMSPEQIAGSGRITARADVWALGVLLYELLCGQRPFDSEDRDVLSELIKSEPPHPPAEGADALDPALRRVIERCLAKSPEDRYAAAADLAADLEAWLNPAAAARRRGWRRVAVAGLCGLIVAAVAVPLALRKPPEQHAVNPAEEQAKQRRTLRATLALGAPFTIIGATGRPVTGERISFCGRPADLLETPDGFFVVDSFRRTAVELIDDPGVDEYRFSVEVRQNVAANPEITRVGIYFGHQGWQLPEGELDHFAEFSFTEQQRPAGTAGERRGFRSFGFRGQWHAAGDTEVSENVYDSMKWRSTFPAGRATPSFDWHRLAVEMRANEVRLFWDDAPPLVVPRKLPDRWVRTLGDASDAPERMPTVLPARAPLGLTVLKGSASYRNARIEPLAGP